MNSATRTRRAAGVTSSEAIRAASIELFFKNGFGAASVRDLARKVGLQVGSLYNYFDNKEDLLVSIIRTTYQTRLARLETSLEDVADPDLAINEFVRLGVKQHTQYMQETVIGDRELMHLAKKDLKEVIALRDRYDNKLTEIIAAGVESGAFVVDDARIITFAIMGMITRISSWYRPKGRLSQATIQELFVDYVRRLLGAKPLDKSAVLIEEPPVINRRGRKQANQAVAASEPILVSKSVRTQKIEAAPAEQPPAVRSRARAQVAEAVANPERTPVKKSARTPKVEAARAEPRPGAKRRGRKQVGETVVVERTAADMKRLRKQSD